MRGVLPPEGAPPSPRGRGPPYPRGALNPVVVCLGSTDREKKPNHHNETNHHADDCLCPLPSTPFCFVPCAPRSCTMTCCVCNETKPGARMRPITRSRMPFLQVLYNGIDSPLQLAHDECLEVWGLLQPPPTTRKRIDHAILKLIHHEDARIRDLLARGGDPSYYVTTQLHRDAWLMPFLELRNHVRRVLDMHGMRPRKGWVF